MNKSAHAVVVVILGKEYKIACAEEETETLLSAARELDRQMREIRDSGKVTSPERIAVMAALNLTHELNQARSMVEQPSRGISDKLVQLRKKLEDALAE